MKKQIKKSSRKKRRVVNPYAQTWDLGLTPEMTPSPSESELQMRANWISSDRHEGHLNMERLIMCGHEIGHMSMVYWRKESLCRSRVWINDDNSGATTRGPGAIGITELMVKLGGPVVEYLMCGSRPKKAIRFRSEYKDPRTDSVKIRQLVRLFCNGIDSRKFQYGVQKLTLSIIEEPSMWAAIVEATEMLYAAGCLDGEVVEEIFERHSPPTMSSSGHLDWVSEMNTALFARLDASGQAIPR